MRRDKEEDDLINQNDEFDDTPSCEFFDNFVSVAMISKPFGFIWDEGRIIKFLKARGYKIINNDSEFSVPLAVKPETSELPDFKDGNIRVVFDEEVKDIILNWLLKNAN